MERRKKSGTEIFFAEFVIFCLNKKRKDTMIEYNRQKWKKAFKKKQKFAGKLVFAMAIGFSFVYNIS